MCDVDTVASESHDEGECTLLRQWGSSVWVGRKTRITQGSVVPDVALGFVDVMIDRHDSVVGNPFVGGPTHLLCEAFGALLRQILVGDDSDSNQLVSKNSWLRDEQPLARAEAEPMDVMVLQAIAAQHGVQLHRRYAPQFRLARARAWLAYHTQLLREGHSLRLLCHCVEGACPLGSCHGQELAGALTWAADRARSLFQVSLQPVQHVSPLGAPHAGCGSGPCMNTYSQLESRASHSKAGQVHSTSVPSPSSSRPGTHALELGCGFGPCAPSSRTVRG